MTWIVFVSVVTVIAAWCSRCRWKAEAMRQSGWVDRWMTNYREKHREAAKAAEDLAEAGGRFADHRAKSELDAAELRATIAHRDDEADTLRSSVRAANARAAESFAEAEKLQTEVRRLDAELGEYRAWCEKLADGVGVLAGLMDQWPR